MYGEFAHTDASLPFLLILVISESPLVGTIAQAEVLVVRLEAGYRRKLIDAAIRKVVQERLAAAKQHSSCRTVHSPHHPRKVVPPFQHPLLAQLVNQPLQPFRQRERGFCLFLRCLCLTLRCLCFCLRCLCFCLCCLCLALRCLCFGLRCLCLPCLLLRLRCLCLRLFLRCLLYTSPSPRDRG